MNPNRLKQYTFSELVGLKESLLHRMEDLKTKIVIIHALGREKSANIKNMYSQISDYYLDVVDIKNQIEKIVANENKL